MVGKPFHVRVRDNGLDYEVYLNGKKMGEGSYKRPEGDTNFRWGMYLGGNEVRHDAMLLVTGAAIDPRDVDETGLEEPDEDSGHAVTEEKSETEDEIPEGLPIPERTWTNRKGETVTAAGVYKPGDDFFSIKVGDKWVRYSLDDMSAADRAALIQAKDFIGEE